jgi:hypothetical protein
VLLAPCPCRRAGKLGDTGRGADPGGNPCCNPWRAAQGTWHNLSRRDEGMSVRAQMEALVGWGNGLSARRPVGYDAPGRRGNNDHAVPAQGHGVRIRD